MARHRLAHAYGHVSARIDAGSFLVSPAIPLGLVEANDQGTVVPLDGHFPADALPEVRMHREIYRRRPTIGGVVRVQPFAVTALSALGRTPRALHGLGTYFAPAAPLWSGTALIRDDAQAAAVADMMGEAAAIVLRGNGCVTAGVSIAEAASLAFFLEDAAKVELALLSATATALEYTVDEAAARAIRAGMLFERMWSFLCSGDPEWQRTQ